MNILGLLILPEKSNVLDFVGPRSINKCLKPGRPVHFPDVSSEFKRGEICNLIKCNAVFHGDIVACHWCCVHFTQSQLPSSLPWKCYYITMLLMWLFDHICLNGHRGLAAVWVVGLFYGIFFSIYFTLANITCGYFIRIKWHNFNICDCDVSEDKTCHNRTLLYDIN